MEIPQCWIYKMEEVPQLIECWNWEKKERTNRSAVRKEGIYGGGGYAIKGFRLLIY